MLGHAVFAAKAVQCDERDVIIAVFQAREEALLAGVDHLDRAVAGLDEGCGGILSRRQRDLTLIRDAARENRHPHLTTLFASHVATFHRFPRATCDARCLFHAITAHFGMKRAAIPYCIG